MKEKITRREMVRSIPVITLGTGFLSWHPGRIFARSSAGLPDNRISVKVSPPGPKSLALVEDVKKYLSRSEYAGYYGVGLKGGNGVYIEDMDGNIYIDCLTAASSAILGYSQDEIAHAYHDTALKIQQTCFGYSPNVEAVELAKKLHEISPGNFEKKVLYGLSGSSSCCGAIEAARKFTRKMGIISFDFAYHGSTGLSQAASGFRSLNEGMYNLNDPDFVKVKFPVSSADCEMTLKNIESVLAFGKTAAVMVEVIQGDGGTLIPPPDFFPRLREMLDRYQVLLIDDEIQSGMGRTGKWWACDHEGIVPDITVIGKGMAAGYAAVSAIIGRKDIMDSMVPSAHGFTLGAHGPSTKAALKTIDIIMDKNLIRNADQIGKRLLQGLKEMEKYPDVVVEARGRGCMIGIEINISKDLLASRIFAFRCLEKGVYFGYIGDKQRTIRVLPPITMNEAECDEVIRVVHETTEEMHHNQIPRQTVEKAEKYAVGW